MTNEVTVSQPDQFIAMMERLAMADNVDVLKIEKMMDLQERILDRNAKQSYMADFSQMQPELPSVERKGTAHNDKKYAKYEDVVNAVRPHLGKFGFGFSHKVNQTDAKIEVICTLTHRSGYSESTHFVAAADASGSKNAVQAVGSTISYGKRYTLLALLGIATEDEDTDGDVFITEEQVLSLNSRLDEIGANKIVFCQTIKVNSLAEIKVKDYANADAWVLRAEQKAKKVTKNGK
jgi:hypothetical protein